MKTQISQLINGSKDVRRELSSKKYEAAPKATSHIGFAGSSCVFRNATAEAVISENPTELNVIADGIKLTLYAHRSTTGKSIHYSCDLNESDALHLLGFHNNPITTYESSFAMIIHNDMTVELQIWARKSPASQWVLRWRQYIGEEFITII